MCIGIPMLIVSAEERGTWCEGHGRRESLNMLLVGEQPPGTWVLAFQGSAVRVLSAEEAARTGAALDALEAALAGNTDLDAFFPDLSARAPGLAENFRGHTS